LGTPPPVAPLAARFGGAPPSFFGAFRLAVRGARAQQRGPKLAVVATFSPAHFEGDWESPTACARTEPYVPGEGAMEYMDGEMLRAEAEEVAPPPAQGARGRGDGGGAVAAGDADGRAARGRLPKCPAR